MESSVNPMESSVNTALDSLFKSEGVKGVLIADEHGLCLGAKGIANPNSAGFISAIATHAKSLHDDPNIKVPIIKIETGKSTILIRNERNHTLAVFK